MGSNPKKGEIDVFFIDIGWVLISFDNNKFYEKVATVSGVNLRAVEKLDKDIFQPLWPKIETSQILPYDFYRQFKVKLAELLLADRREQFTKVFTYKFFREASASVFKLKPKVLDFLCYLRSVGCKLMLTSNTYSILYEAQVSLFPQIFAIVDGCVVSHEVGVRKPSQIFWSIAQNEAGLVSPERIFVVDDIKENVDSAKELGMNGAVFSNVGELKKDLEKFGFVFKK